MLTQVNEILNQAATRIVGSIANFLPGVLALVVVLVFAVVLAWIARMMIRRSLRGIDFDKRLDRWGFSGMAEWSPSHSPSLLLAGIAYWFIVLVGLLVGLSALNATVTSALVLRLFNYLPNVVAACLRCNLFKGNRTLEEARLRLIREPVHPQFLFSVHLLRHPHATSFLDSWRKYLVAVPSTP